MKKRYEVKLYNWNGNAEPRSNQRISVTIVRQKTIAALAQRIYRQSWKKLELVGVPTFFERLLLDKVAELRNQKNGESLC